MFQKLDPSRRSDDFKSTKRSRDAEEYARRRTRTKLTPVDSSGSEPSISEDSALIPTSVPDDSTGASDFDSDNSSELSESSEEPSDDSSSEEDSDAESEAEEDSDAEIVDEGDTVVNLIANRGKKPKMKLSKEELGPDIRTFLKDFLPQLKAANEELEVARQAGTLKDEMIEGEDIKEGDAEGQYIEMDLGLGVLEEKREDDASDTSSSDNESDEESGSPKEKDVMGRLMGRQSGEEQIGIQEVVDEPGT